MDVAVFIIISVFQLVLAFLGFMGRKAGWSVFPIFGALVGGVGLGALYTDGNLTINGATLAAANGVFFSDFNALSVVPLALTLACLMVAARRIFKI